MMSWQGTSGTPGGGDLMGTLEFTENLCLGSLAPREARGQHSWTSKQTGQLWQECPGALEGVRAGSISPSLTLKTSVQMQGENTGLPWPVLDSLGECGGAGMTPFVPTSALKRTPSVSSRNPSRARERALFCASDLLCFMMCFCITLFPTGESQKAKANGRKAYVKPKRICQPREQVGSGSASNRGLEIYLALLPSGKAG